MVSLVNMATALIWIGRDERKPWLTIVQSSDTEEEWENKKFKTIFDVLSCLHLLYGLWFWLLNESILLVIKRNNELNK